MARTYGLSHANAPHDFIPGVLPFPEIAARVFMPDKNVPLPVPVLDAEASLDKDEAAWFLVVVQGVCCQRKKANSILDRGA